MTNPNTLEPCPFCGTREPLPITKQTLVNMVSKINSEPEPPVHVSFQKEIQWKPPVYFDEAIPMGHVWIKDKDKIICCLGDCCDEKIKEFEVPNDH